MDKETDDKVKRIVRRSFIDSNVCFKSTKFYDLTESQSKRATEPKNIESKGVIDQLDCRDCEKFGKKEFYIGETGRFLKARLSEHFSKLRDRRRLTEVGKHDINEHGGFDKSRWKISVLHQEEDEFKRRSLESAYTGCKKPTLNSNKGISFICKDLILNKRKLPVSVMLN